MTKEEIQKEVSSLVGQYLVPLGYDLKLFTTDKERLLAFKERIDLTFNADFDSDKITQSKNINELVDHIYHALKTGSRYHPYR
jgi:hypothetical protein